MATVGVKGLPNTEIKPFSNATYYPSVDNSFHQCNLPLTLCLSVSILYLSVGYVRFIKRWPDDIQRYGG